MQTNINPIEHVKHLSDTIGPRRPGSKEEELAAEYVRDCLLKTGLSPRMEIFSALQTYSWLYAAMFSLFIAACLIMFSPAPEWVALALCTAGFLFYVPEVSTFETLGRLFPKKRSRNVVADIASAETPTRRVIVMAHIDSSRSGIFFHPKLVKGFRQSFYTTLACMAIIFVCAGWRMSYSAPASLMWLSAAAAAYLSTAALLLAHRELAGKDTPGAVDNASGVAALLLAAEELAARPLKNTAVTIVATGAEESGLFGAINFLKKHRPAPCDMFINIDHAGTGRIHYTAREGMLLRRNTSAAMAAAAAKFIMPSSGAPPPKKDFGTMLTDGYAFLMRGIQGVSIMAFRDDGSLANWHWHTDVSEHISTNNLTDAAALALHILRELDRENRCAVFS